MKSIDLLKSFILDDEKSLPRKGVTYDQIS